MSFEKRWFNPINQPLRRIYAAYYTSVRFRFMSLIGFSILIPILILAIWSYQYITRSQLNTAYDNQLHQLSYVDLWISAQLNNRQKEIMALLIKQPSLIASDSSLRKYTSLPPSTRQSPKELALQRTFDQFRSTFPDVAFMFLGLEDGSYVESPQFKPQKPYNPTERPWYLNTQLQGTFKIGSPYYTSVSNQLVVGVTQPIQTSSGLKGVVGFTMEISSLSERIHKNKIVSNEHMILVNPEGMIVVSPIQTDWISKPANQVLPIALLEPLNKISSSEGGSTRYNRFYNFSYPTQSKIYSAIVHKLPHSEWKIIALIDQAQLFKQNRQLLYIYLLSFFITICLSLYFIWRFVGRFTKPLESIGQTISSDNYLHPEGIEEIENYRLQSDEIGLIARAVLQLIENRRLISDNQQRLAITTQLTTQAYWDYGVQEELLFLNPSMSDLLHLPQRMSLLSLDFIWSNVSSQHLPVLRAALQNLISGDLKKIEVAIQLQVSPSQFKWFLARAEGMQHAGDAKPNRIIGVLIDIDQQRQQLLTLEASNNQLETLVAVRTTELTALNEELIATNEELESALQFIREKQEELLRFEKLHTMSILVSGVAHEVNTPLGISITLSSYLIAQSESLLKNYKSGQLSRNSFVDYLDQTKESLNVLHLNLEKTASLIESLRVLNKSNEADEPTPFSIQEVLDDILLSLKPALEKKNITVSTLLHINKSFWGTPQHFNQIITNLLLNSIKHAFDSMSQPAHIAIRIALQNKSLMITYTDNGSGIPDAVAKHIFDPFFTTKRGSGGTGLGLYLVYNLVTINSGGSIQYQPLHPHGSQFNITLQSNEPKE